MSVNPYNSEKYHDPTVYLALSKIEREERKRFRKRAFICSPFAGDTDYNVQKAREYCLFAKNSGYAPFAPHLIYPQFMDDADPNARNEAIRCGISYLFVCHELWVFGKITRGMSSEIKQARKRGIPIRFFTERCEEYVLGEEESNAQSTEYPD